MRNKVILILSILIILLIGCKAEIDDRISDKDRKIVEEVCRSTIAAWEDDVMLYKSMKGIDDERAEEAKASANATAESYNEYILEHAYVFNGKLPHDIYAMIEPIE